MAKSDSLYRKKINPSDLTKPTKQFYWCHYNFPFSARTLYSSRSFYNPNISWVEGRGGFLKRGLDKKNWQTNFLMFRKNAIFALGSRSDDVECIRGVDSNKRTVATHSYSLLLGIRIGHYMSNCLFLSLLLATSWPKLRFAIIECAF